MTLCIGGPCAGQRMVLPYGKTSVMVEEYSPLTGPLSDPRTVAHVTAHRYVMDMLSVNNRQVPVLRWNQLKSEDLIIELLDQYLPNVAMTASRHMDTEIVNHLIDELRGPKTKHKDQR